ncbi:hypothetical protein BV25DRAFT_1915143 [Artomyces pyxidatus]|uniref:Uncharacterized protein n=1 Tax=Artomyces pyxidatus TaxID=48021 RepID=A0ACB8T6B2_9AGAM|nr:hypothetical protein BV25DRAFT_1915143 [Artomyces pyxidatus]
MSSKECARVVTDSACYPHSASENHSSASNDAIQYTQNTQPSDLQSVASAVGALHGSHVYPLYSGSRLPPEILSYIFENVKHDEPVWGSVRWAVSTASSPPPILQRLGWIKVSHVCRHWRQTALDNPLLWQDISFCLGTHWTEEQLSRSIAVPINVTLSNSDMLTWEIQCVAEHTARTKELVIKCDGMYPASLATLVQSSAPVLEKLVWDLHHELDEESMTQAPWLCLDQTPRLRELTFMNTVRLPSSVDSTVYANLTHLHIRNTLVHSANFDQGELLSVLAKLPHLESLVLVKCVPKVPPAAKHATVALPRLSHLVAIGLVNSCASLMQHLQVPTSTLDVSFGLKWHGSPRSMNALQTLLAHQADFAIPLHTVAVLWARYPTKLFAWRRRTMVAGGLPPSDLRLHVRDYSLRNDLDPIPPSLPLHAVRTLHVIYKNGYPRSIWPRLHAHFAHVEHIVVRVEVPEMEASVMESLREALICLPQQGPVPEADQTLPFPRLAGLTLTLASPLHPDFLYALKTARQQAGCPLEITVRPPSVPAAHVSFT